MKHVGENVKKIAGKAGAALLASATDLAALLGLAAIGVGCWWERPSAGLIVPGAIVLSFVVFARVTGRS